MTIEQILEIIERYKLRIPPTVYYDLLADVQEAEEEQEPKTGHWIWCVGSHKCSNCEEYTCFSHKELLRYCPNCGAKMVETEVEDGNEKINL